MVVYPRVEVTILENAVKTKQRPVKRWFLISPVRHILTLIGAVVIALYFLLRSNTPLIEKVCSCFTRPWHLWCSCLLSALPFSMADVIIALGVLAALTYIIYLIVTVIRRKVSVYLGLYRFFITVMSCVCVIYALFCVLWGVYYYTADFEKQSGLYAQPISAEQLETVTEYFAQKANYYSSRVARDPEGAFCEERGDILALSANIYDNVEKRFPCLDGNDIPVKGFFFSTFMDYATYTGFFFPFTGESNVNINSPACMLASTCAHELAHQRGVAAEDEANFVAVLSSMESENDIYCYSASLLAYIHLGNALHKADYEAWENIYYTLNEYVVGDLRENNVYWERFETPVSTVADAVYTKFLESYGQELGLQSYGACVDLLVAYYYDIAKGA